MGAITGVDSGVIIFADNGTLCRGRTLYIVNQSHVPEMCVVTIVYEIRTTDNE